MDLMHQPDWLHAAMERILKRSRGKAAGVDRVTVKKFTEHRLSEKFEELRLELRNGIYRPKPLRRVEIPKANGKMRPLGIPCLRDKIVQEAVRMALEPIFEVEFHDNSYWVSAQSKRAPCRFSLSTDDEKRVYMGHRRRCESLFRRNLPRIHSQGSS